MHPSLFKYLLIYFAHTCAPFPPSYLYLHHVFHTIYLTLNLFRSIQYQHSCILVSYLYLCPLLTSLPTPITCTIHLHQLLILLPEPITYIATNTYYLHYSTHNHLPLIFSYLATVLLIFCFILLLIPLCPTLFE